MERALAAVGAVLNKIEAHFWQCPVAFALFIAHDDAESLAHYLKLAVDAERSERQRLLRS